jgi:hypothetical protein
VALCGCISVAGFALGRDCVIMALHSTVYAPYVRYIKGNEHIKYHKMWLIDICICKCLFLNCACSMVSNGRIVVIICRIACRIDCISFSWWWC